MSKIQNEGVKSEAEILAGGGAKSQLINDTKIYVTADGLNKRLDEAIVDGDIGGGGSGGINHLLDQSEDAAPWTNDANFTISNNAVSPIRPTLDEDLQIDKAAVDASGEVISVAFTIDPADRAKMLPLSFDYINSGTYSDGDYEVELYDVTNAVVITNTNPEIIDRDTIIGSHLTYWQSAVDSTSYELRFKCITTDTNASSMNLDKLQTGPVNCKGSGAFISDWTKDGEWVPTGSWTSNATYTGKYYRDGNHLVGWAEVLATGNPTPDVVLEIDIPFNIDANKFPDELVVTGTGHHPVGQVIVRNTVSLLGRAAVTQSSIAANRVQCFYDNNGITQDQLQTVNQSGAGGIGAGDVVRVEFRVPIVGWETGIKPNEVVSGRDIVFSAYLGTAKNIPDNTQTPVDGWVVRDDTAGMFDGGFLVTIPEYGFYDLSASGQTSTDGGTDLARANVYLLIVDPVLGSITYEGEDGAATSGNSGRLVPNLNAFGVRLNKGATIEYRFYQDNISGNSLNLNANSSTTFWQVARRNSLNAQTQPTETVAARYVSDSAQALPANTVTTFVYEDRIYDTHNSYDPVLGEYSAPVSGVYKANAKTIYTFPSGSPDVIDIQFDVNGTAIEVNRKVNSASLSIQDSVQLGASFYLNAGDVLKVRMFTNNNAKNSLTLNQWNTFSITKIGN